MARKQRTVPADNGAVNWPDLWPDVACHLARVLRFRMPVGCESADVIQETAARLHACGRKFESREEVLRFATRIAINISVDLQRRSRVLSWSALSDDVPGLDDVEREVVAKAQLAELCRQMSLTPGELERLVGCESAEDRTSAGKSRRYRSRQQLRRLRDALGGLVGVPSWRWLLGGVAAVASVVPPALSNPMTAQAPAQAARLSMSPEAAPAVARSVDSAAPGPREFEPRSEAPGHARAVAPDSTYRSQVKLQAPNGAGLEKGQREHPGGEPSYLACVRNIAPAPDACVPHPLRE